MRSISRANVRKICVRIGRRAGVGAAGFAGSFHSRRASQLAAAKRCGPRDALRGIWRGREESGGELVRSGLEKLQQFVPCGARSRLCSSLTVTRKQSTTLLGRATTSGNFGTDRSRMKIMVRISIAVVAVLGATSLVARAEEPKAEEIAACDHGKGQVCLDLGVRYFNGDTRPRGCHEGGRVLLEGVQALGRQRLRLRRHAHDHGNRNREGRGERPHASREGVRSERRWLVQRSRDRVVRGQRRRTVGRSREGARLLR